MTFPQLLWSGKKWRHRNLKIPLRLVLTVPFVLLTLGTSGLVGYLSWQNGQRSISRLANQFIGEVEHRTTNHIRSYLETAHLANANHANSIELTSPNSAALEQYLCRQLQLYPSVSATHLSDPQGKFIGIVRNATGQISVHERSTAANASVRAVALDQQCRQGQSLASPGNFDPRDRPWYQAAVRAKQAVWSPIFAWKASPVIGTNAALPVYDAGGKLRYVLGTSLVLSDISKYLRTLEIGRSGQVFIVERNGLFVASSTAKDPVIAAPTGQPKRRSAFETDAPLLKASADYVQQNYGGFQNITQPQQISAQFNRSNYFLQVIPLADPRGIDWLMLIVVPEADFLEQINANTQSTLLLSAGALLGSILIGLWLTRSIVRPIQHLGQISFALSNGDWSGIGYNSPIAELQVLNRSFHRMADQLQQSFDRIKTALQESEEKFTLIFRTSPDPIAIISSDWKYLEVNDAFVQLSEYSRAEIIGRTSVELGFWINLEERDRYLQLLQVEGRVRNGEACFRTRSGRQLVMLMSIENVELQGQTSFVVVTKEISDRKQLELDLQHSQARLNDILASTITAICQFRLDAAGQVNYEYFSPSNVAVFGYTPEELMADPLLWRSQLHPDDREHVLLNMPPQTDEGSFSTEYRFYHKDGTIRWILDSVKFRRDETQTGWIVTGVAIDNTARKQAEQALAESEATKNHILRAIPDLMIWMTADGTCLDFINSDSLPKLYVKLEAIGENSYKLLPPELAQARMNAINQARETGEVIVYEQQLELESEIRHEEVRVVSVGGDRILVIVRDISKRHRAEAALLDSEERFRSAFENASIGMALIALNGRWLKVNPSLCEMLDYSEVELLEMNATAFVHPEDLDHLKQFVEQARLNERHSVQFELRYYSHDRSIAWGRLSLSVVRDSQREPLYYVVQIQDITQQQAIDRLKNEFISVVSHELRTPLTAIQGCLGLLETGVYDNRPEKAKRMLHLAIVNSDRLVRLVNDILDLERLDSGRIELIKEKCDAQELIQRAVEGVSAIADQNAVQLATQPTQLQVWAAPDAIIQTLINLLSNAIKFSAPNSVVSVSVHAQPDAVQFQVKDQGRGIPADKLESIFGRFQQVDVSDARQKGGTGLGLAICQSIVQQHGGNIWAESILGHGSTFCFTLPNPERNYE